MKVKNFIPLSSALSMCQLNYKQKSCQDFSGGPVVKTLCFHCRGHGFDPWLGNRFHMSHDVVKKIKKKIKKR